MILGIKHFGGDPKIMQLPSNTQLAIEGEFLKFRKRIKIQRIEKLSLQIRWNSLCPPEDDHPRNPSSHSVLSKNHFVLEGTNSMQICTTDPANNISSEKR
jgi:hypothetical protein